MLVELKNKLIMYYTTALNTACTADICVRHNRVKQYGQEVYLKDGQEFEIELYNPTTGTKLVKISINGKPISSSGLVIKPGQRAYLERFIDTAKKFKFETYTVDGTPSALAAIANNGDVIVEFYDEEEVVVYRSPSPVYFMNSSGTSITCDSTFTTSLTSGTGYGGQDVNSISRSNMPPQDDSFTEEVETGRVEQGGSSSQRFKKYVGKFNTYTSNVVRIKLLPESSKPKEVGELVGYCTNCGTKNRKNNYRYCPKCGTQF